MPTQRQLTEPTICYQLGEIIYVPHYRLAGLYVGPHRYSRLRKEHTAYSLTKLGAKQITLELWPRPSLVIQPALHSTT